MTTRLKLELFDRGKALDHCAFLSIEQGTCSYPAGTPKLKKSRGSEDEEP